MQTEKAMSKAVTTVHCENFFCANWKDNHCTLPEIIINLKGLCCGTVPITLPQQTTKDGQETCHK